MTGFRTLAALTIATILYVGSAANAATTYYVSPTGHDTSTGTIGTPFLTIGKAIAVSSSGDTIMVNDGTYKSTGNVDLSVTAPITITSINGAGSTVIDCGGTHAAFAISGGTSGTPIVLKGLTIQNGLGPNSITGSVTLSSAYAQITNCRLVNNQPNSALQVDGLSNCSVTGCVFAGNVSDSGGAIRNNGTLSITSSIFNGNRGASDGGALYNGGTATIYQTTFDGNSCPGGGGAIDNLGTITMSNCLLHGNRGSAAGGGIYSIATANLSFCSILGNTSGQGGGIWNDNPGSLTVKNCLIASNQASSGGGCGNNGTSHIYYTTIAANVTEGDGAGDVEVNDAAGTFVDDIIWGNTTGLDLNANVHTVITNCDHNSNSIATNSFNADPQYVDPANGDFSLKATSPCRHAAITVSGITTDLKGRPRSTSTPTMGAYEGGTGGEFQFTASAAGPDGVERDLWQGISDDAGYVALWRVVPPANPTATHKFTATNLGRPLFIACGPNGHERILFFDSLNWKTTIWDVANDFSFSTVTLGPNLSTVPTAMNVGTDNHLHVTFTTLTGSVTMYNIATNGTFTTKSYGPY